MDKKILPMHYPPVTAYHYHSDLLSVILNHEEALPWLYNNYIQLEIPPCRYRVPNHGRLDYHFPYSVWKSCPFVYYQRISRDFIKFKWESAVDFLTDCINLGYYAYFDYDQYYIKGNGVDVHRSHDLFVYGYDRNERVFYITENFADGRYTYLTVGFDELLLAYEEHDKVKPPRMGEGVELISYFKRGHKLDVPYIMQSIRDYLDGSNTNVRVVPDDYRSGTLYRHVYGIKTYENIYYFLETVFPNDREGLITEYRLPHVFSEHKRLMLDRLAYLSQLGYIDNAQYIYSCYDREVKQPADVVKNLFLKYYALRDERLLRRTAEKVRQIEAAEVRILSYLLENMDPCPAYERVAPVTGEACPVLRKRVEVKHGCSVSLQTANLSSRQLYFETTDFKSIGLTISGSKVTAQALSVGEGHIYGKDREGNIHVDIAVSVFPESLGFVPNLKNTESSGRGEWTETPDGLVGRGFSAILTARHEGRHFTFSADICPIEPGSYGMLLFYCNDEVTRTNAVFIDTRDGKLKLSNSRFNIDTSQQNICAGRTYNLKISVSDKNLRAYLDGRLCIEYDDLEFDFKNIGIKAMQGKVRFQNVMLGTEK